MSKLQIDPKWALLLAIVVGFIDATASGAVTFPQYVPADWVTALTQTNAFLVKLWTLVIGPAVIALSSDKAGPLTALIAKTKTGGGA